MLRWRLLVAAIIVAPLLALLVVDFRYNLGAPGIWLSPLTVVFAMLGVAEMLDLFGSKQLRPAPWAAYLGTLAVVVSAMVPLAWNLSGSGYPDTCPIGRLGWPVLGLAVALGIAFVAELRRFRDPGQATVHVALALFIAAYLGLLMTFLLALRLHHDNAWGMSALVSLIFVTKMSDTGAYTFGRLFGRHKMSPRVSPGKTIEGGIGGLATACVCAWLYFAVIGPWIVGADAPRPSWWAAMIYGLVVATAGVLGDLSESLLKRDMERKDSSRWIPGLGGVLDVLDSLTLAAPAAYLCWVSGLLGP